MSFKVEVIADDSGKWYVNALRFATREEAQIYATNLMWRWTLITLVRDTRIVECDDPVTEESP
jgi:hypothetical protein